MNETDLNKESVLFEAVLNASEVLALSNDINNIIGINLTPETKGINPNTESGIRALYLMRIYQCLYSMFSGNKEYMRLWLTGYDKGTDGIPLEQLKDVNGLVLVMEYLESMHYGKL